MGREPKPNSLAGRRARDAARLADQNEAIILSVRLESGQFETSIRVPIKPGMKADDFKKYTERWLELALTGLQVGVESMELTMLENKKDSPNAS